jgi:uncharacterized damage-inducible protein DinB
MGASRARGWSTVTLVAQLQSSLQLSRSHLFAAIRGLNEEQFRHVPSSGVWPIAAHLAHLLRIERVYAERAHAALAEDEPLVASTRIHNDDDPGLAQHLAVPQIIHGLLNTRRDLEFVLAGCDEGALNRSIKHETLGRMTLAQIMAKMSGHEAEHTAEIVGLVKQAPASARVTIPLVSRS